MNATKTKVIQLLDSLSSEQVLECYSELQKIMFDKLDKAFKQDVMREAWQEWIEYKRLQHKFKFKSEKTEMYQKLKLFKDCNGDLQQMINTIFETMANGYKGLTIYESRKQTTRTEQSRPLNPLW